MVGVVKLKVLSFKLKLCMQMIIWKVFVCWCCLWVFQMLKCSKLKVLIQHHIINNLNTIQRYSVGFCMLLSWAYAWYATRKNKGIVINRISNHIHSMYNVTNFVIDLSFFNAFIKSKKKLTFTLIWTELILWT